MAGTKSTKIEIDIQRSVDLLFERYPILKALAEAIDKQEGRALLVGGAVRDMMLGIPTKDLDIEVHGIELDKLEAILRQFGPVDLVGKSFGVLRVHPLDIDWSVPRADSAGRKPSVALDPHMAIKDAFARRDLTINAMGVDLLTYELIDPFGGYNDLQAGILRAPDIARFIEDPLRFFRVMQFVGRFAMYPDEELSNCCASMNIVGVSIERIAAEFEKLFLKSLSPSRGIRWLGEINRLKDVLPEVYATIGVPQDPIWHPEGDVFEHTMQSIDAAAQIDYHDHFLNLVLRYAALCHDLGKATTTSMIDDRWRSLGHELAGVDASKKLLARITQKKDLVHDVCTLVKYHLLPGQFVEQKARLAAYRRLASKLSPRLSLAILADLARADKRGRNGKNHEPLKGVVPVIEEFLARAREAAVEQRAQDPVLHGRDLLDVVPPGPDLGRLVKEAYRIQLEEGILDKDILKARVLENYVQN